MGNPLESLHHHGDHALTHARRKEIASLDRKKGRNQLGQFLIEGRRSLESAFDGEATLFEVFLSGDAELGDDLMSRVRSSGVPVFELTKRLERQFADTANPQGVIAVAGIPTPEVSALAVAKHVLLLDGLQDPGNVGTLVRTAAWFGVDCVCSLPGTADFFGPKVIRATMGGVWDVPLFRFSEADELISLLDDVPLWGADLAGTPVGSWEPGIRSVLVIGSEAHGLSNEVSSALAGRVHIPGGRRQCPAHISESSQAANAGPSGDGTRPAAAESLNAAVAGGILIAAWTGVVG